MINKEEILKTITIICSHENVATAIKETLTKSEFNIEPLRNVTMVHVETGLNGANLQDCTGIDIAYKMLINEPTKKIILYHVIPLEFIRKKNQKLDIVLVKPNVRFLEIPFTAEALVNAFESKNVEIDSETTKNALNKHIQGQLSGIWHDIRKASDPLHPEEGWVTDMVAKGIETAKELFPMLIDKDNTFIITFLEEVSRMREEIRKGEDLEGTFCDMEGTLFSNDILNEGVLSFLRKDEREGKSITLWTDGNIPELQSLLNIHEIPYQLHPKRNFAGAVVETAIDDMDENSFTAVTKIYAKTFIRVQDIPV